MAAAYRHLIQAMVLIVEPKPVKGRLNTPLFVAYKIVRFSLALPTKGYSDCTTGFEEMIVR